MHSGPRFPVSPRPRRGFAIQSMGPLGCWIRTSIRSLESNRPRKCKEVGSRGKKTRLGGRMAMNRTALLAVVSWLEPRSIQYWLIKKIVSVSVKGSNSDLTYDQTPPTSENCFRAPCVPVFLPVTVPLLLPLSLQSTQPAVDPSHSLKRSSSPSQKSRCHSRPSSIFSQVELFQRDKYVRY